MVTTKRLVAGWMMLAAGCAADRGDQGARSSTLSGEGGTSSDPPYLVPLREGVSFQALLTVGDESAKHGYRLVGIPDGMGAWGAGNHFTLYLNHEIPVDRGVPRAHGAAGAFVSKWKIDRETGRVEKGEDLIREVALWNVAEGRHDAPATGVPLARFCSGDLPPRSAFYDDATGLGYDGRIYMNGEEVGTGGRAFAHDTETGISWELPHLGKMQFENALARGRSGVKTVVVGTDDTTPGEVAIYVGTKMAHGSPVVRAGLTNGSLYSVAVTGHPVEPVVGGIPSGTRFTMLDHGDVSAMSFTELQDEQTAGGATKFARPEDGAWNPTDNRQFLFATTATFTTSPRLWRLVFDDADDPAAGGIIEMLIDGATVSVDGVTPKAFDNITVTDDGEWVYLQEDPGNVAHLAKIWRYNLHTGAIELIAQHDPARFTAGLPGFMTQDEESSGIIDASSFLGPGKLLLTSQVHVRNPDPELVEYGQLLIMTVAP